MRAGVSAQLARPPALVVAAHCAAPSTNATVAPATAAGGAADTSVSDAATFTACPGAPALGLGLRVRNVACFPGVHVTRARFDVSAVAPTVVVATITSSPAFAATYVNGACPAASVRTILICGFAPLTWKKTGVPAGADAF